MNDCRMHIPLLLCRPACAFACVHAANFANLSPMLQVLGWCGRLASIPSVNPLHTDLQMGSIYRMEIPQIHAKASRSLRRQTRAAPAPQSGTPAVPYLEQFGGLSPTSEASGLLPTAAASLGDYGVRRNRASPWHIYTNIKSALTCYLHRSHPTATGRNCQCHLACCTHAE